MSKYEIRVSTDEDIATLPWYDHTTLSATERCPRYALLAYRNNKRVPGYRPGDALLAGGAAHKFFAAWNIYEKDIHHTFTETELENCYAAAEAAEVCGKQTAFALEALYTHSDGLPVGGRKGSDKIEDSCLFWSRMQTHGHEIVSTEQRFCITINDSWRYTGLMDCIQRSKRGTLIPVEYKTTGRIDKGYESKWFMSNQITGYYIAMLAYQEAGLLPDGKLSDYIDLEAIQLPMTKTPTNIPHMRVPFEREPFHLEQFMRWAESKIEVLNKSSNCDTPWDAEIHETCYQYNSTCAFLYSFCNYDEETRHEIFDEQLETHIWDPNNELG